MRAVELTPYARKEFITALEQSPDPLERARRFYARCWMSISYNKLRETGWRMLPRNAGGGHVPQRLFAKTKHLLKIARRLKEVQFESRDFRELFPLVDHPGTLIYLDPPYPGFCDRLYNVPFSDGDYGDLMNLCFSAKSMIVLSGYVDMREQLLLQGWQMIEKPTRNRKRAARIECLMINPAAQQALKVAV